MREASRGASLIQIFLFSALMCGAASGQTTDIYGRKIDPNVREVEMIRQDQSDCSNSNVNDKDRSVLGGNAVVARGSDGKTTVKIAIMAKPNSVYHFFLKCVRLLGDIKTYDEGDGQALFTFSTNEVGNVYGFDMYPEGAPPGNKYQSMQVKY
jgi:hypothetical protein